MWQHTIFKYLFTVSVLVLVLRLENICCACALVENSTLYFSDLTTDNSACSESKEVYSEFIMLENGDEEEVEILFDNFNDNCSYVNEAQIIRDILDNRNLFVCIPEHVLLNQRVFIFEKVLSKLHVSDQKFIFEVEKILFKATTTDPIKDIDILFIALKSQYNHIITHFAPRIVSIPSILSDIIADGDHLIIFECLENVLNLKFVGRSLLTHCIKYNRKNLVNYFVKHIKCSIKPAQNEDNLLFSIEKSADTKIIESLLRAQVDTFGLNSQRETVLINWIKKGIDLKNIQLIFKDSRFKKRNNLVNYINAKSDTRSRAITVALRMKRYDVLEFLLKNGADVNVYVPNVNETEDNNNNNYNSILFDDILNGMSHIAIGKPVNINRFCLNWAIYYNDPQACKLILLYSKMRAIPTNSLGESLLADAIRGGNVQLMKQILSGKPVKIESSQLNLNPEDEEIFSLLEETRY